MARPLPIYFDAPAGMPLLPEAAAAMREYLTPGSGLQANPQSVLHRHGQAAAQAVDGAGKRVAALLGAATRPEDIIWTSCATESIRLAFDLAMESFQGPGWTPSREGDGWHPVVVTFAAEHSATLEAADDLRTAGRATVRVLGCDGEGRYDPALLDGVLEGERRAGRRFLFVSLLWANNEVGTVQDVRALAEVCLRHGALLHVDGTQAVGWLETGPAAVPGLGLMSFSSHKIGGPSGAGALWVRTGGEGALNHDLSHARFRQELVRPGTLPVPAIVGFGAAAGAFRLRRGEYGADAVRQCGLLLEGIFGTLSGTKHENVIVQGAPFGVGSTRRLPNILSLGIEGVAGAELYGNLAGRVDCSAASACRTRLGRPSHVLAAMGVSAERAFATLRLGVWPGQPEEEVVRGAQIIGEAIGAVLP